VEVETSSPVVTTDSGVTHLAAGQAPDLYGGPDPYLDPKLAEIRDAEAKRNDAVTVEDRPEPSIDPALVEARDAEIKRLADRANSDN
jgi:hypothetical protein